MVSSISSSTPAAVHFPEFLGNFDDIEDFFQKIMDIYYTSFGAFPVKRYFVFEEKSYVFSLNSQMIFFVQEKEANDAKRKETKMGMKLQEGGVLVNIFLEGRPSYEHGAWKSIEEKNYFEVFWKKVIQKCLMPMDCYYRRGSDAALLLHIQREKVKDFEPQLDMIYLLNPQYIDLRFLSESGVDSGGLRREYLRLLFNGIREQPGRLCFQKNPHSNFLELDSCGNLELTSKRLQALGQIVAWAYLSGSDDAVDDHDRSVLIAKQFDDKFFKALFLIPENVLDGFEDPHLDTLIALEPQLESLKKSFSDLEEQEKSNFEALSLLESGTLDSQKWESLKDEHLADRWLRSMALVEIAKGVRRYLQIYSDSYENWDEFRTWTDVMEFELKVQGQIDRQDLFDRLYFKQQVIICQEWFSEWIFAINDEEKLKKFLGFITGGEALGPEMYITIELLQRDQPLVHTCNRTLRLPKLATQSKEELHEFLENITGLEGFDHL